MNRLRASNVGPVTEADIRFGDLTVFVGPQATGKSIFLQLLKLLVDRPAIHRTMKAFGIPAPDPGAENVAEAGWGGLTGFSSQVGDIVAEVVNRQSPTVP